MEIVATTSLPVDRLAATDCIAAARANKPNVPQPVLMNEQEPVLNTDLLQYHDLATYLLQVDGNCSHSSDSSEANQPWPYSHNPEYPWSTWLS